MNSRPERKKKMRKKRASARFFGARGFGAASARILTKMTRQVVTYALHSLASFAKSPKITCLPHRDLPWPQNAVNCLTHA